MSVTGSLFESRVAGKPVVANFDGDQISSDGSLLLAMAEERRIGLVRCISECLTDRRDVSKVRESETTMLTQRIFGVVGGY